MEYTYANQPQYHATPSRARTGRNCGCGGPRTFLPQPSLTQGPFIPGPGPFPPGPGPFPPGPGPFPPGPGPFPPGPGPFPPGPGPFPPGPGPFPPGPGPFPPGPGPFPPGPGPFPPGPGPFPPGPGPFPPGPGPFPPGPGPFPPGPGPFPPGPGPFPPGPRPSVTVIINGGRAFPQVTQAYRVPFRPGLSIYQALAETGVVRFNFNGQIVSVGNVPIGGNTRYRLLLNGRIIPSTLLSFPVQRNDSVAIELIFNPLLREEEHETEITTNNN